MMPHAAAMNSTPHATALRPGVSAVVAGVPQTEPRSKRLDMGTWATGSAQARNERLASTRPALRSETRPSLSPASMGATASRLATSRANGKESAECLTNGVDGGAQPWAATLRGSFLAAPKPTAAHHRIIFTKFRCEIRCFGLTRAYQLDAADLFLLASALSLAVACIFRLLGV